MRSDQAIEVAKQLVQLYRSTFLGRCNSIAFIWRLQRVSIMCTSKLITVYSCTRTLCTPCILNICYRRYILGFVPNMRVFSLKYRFEQK
jgi:hypothetical protein